MPKRLELSILLFYTLACFPSKYLAVKAIIQQVSLEIIFVDFFFLSSIYDIICFKNEKNVRNVLIDPDWHACLNGQNYYKFFF